MKKYFLFFLAILLPGCSDRKVDTRMVKEEMKAREIRIVPDARIVQKAHQIGDSLVAGFSFTRSIVGAEEVFEWHFGETGTIECRALLFTDTYQLDEKEQAVFEAYRYNSENQLVVGSNVQKLPDRQQLLYTAPIMTEGRVMGIWSVKIPQKQIVLSIDP